MQAISKTKRYKCKQCLEVFAKERVNQLVCSAGCASVYGGLQGKKIAAKKAAAERKETKAKLDKIATKPKLSKILKTALHTYIRQRDYGMPCISCGKPIAWGSGATGGVCDAGHYRSVGSSAHLRFEPTNIHAQCKHCNSVNGLGGNYANYRTGLIKRYGIAHVEKLESDNTPRKYTHDDLRNMTEHYKKLLKELKNEPIRH